MPRFNAPADRFATRPGYGSGFDNVAMRDTFADFRSWWDRGCLLRDTPQQPKTAAALPMAA